MNEEHRENNPIQSLQDLDFELTQMVNALAAHPHDFQRKLHNEEIQLYAEGIKKQEELVDLVKKINEANKIENAKLKRATKKQFAWSLTVAIAGVVIGAVLGILGIVF